MVVIGNHINWVENRNGITKRFLKRRGGGSRNETVLHRNLGEVLFRQWFSPRGTNQTYDDVLMFVFSIWACYGFHQSQIREENHLPSWLLEVYTVITSLQQRSEDDCQYCCQKPTKPHNRHNCVIMFAV
jgi:hypothetical protein